jgi:hypothetical protein
LFGIVNGKNRAKVTLMKGAVHIVLLIIIVVIIIILVLLALHAGPFSAPSTATPL